MPSKRTESKLPFTKYPFKVEPVISSINEADVRFTMVESSSFNFFSRKPDAVLIACALEGINT